MMATFPDYRWYFGPRGVVVVEDRGLGGLSVTNGAERVVADILAVFPALPARPVVYRDSEGRWDGLRVTPEGRFGGFYAIGAASRDEALRLLPGVIAEDRALRESVTMVPR